MPHEGWKSKRRMGTGSSITLRLELGVVFAPIFPFNILLLVLFFVNPIPTDFISFVFLYVASPRKRYKAVSNNALIRLPLHMD